MKTAPVRVLMSSTSYPSTLTDWRGLFIRHLADSIARRESVELSLWAPPGETHPNVRRATTESDDAFLSQLMKAGGVAHLMRQGGLRGLLTPVELIRRLKSAYRRGNPDLYHVNWLQSAIPLPKDRKPLLVTALGTDMQLLKSPIIKHLLRRALSSRPVLICPNAEWMIPSLEAHFGDIADIQFMPFGIDPAWYSIERPASGFSLPARWLVVSRLTHAKLGPLFEWCSPLFKDAARELHLFGPMQEEIIVPSWVRYHGPASPSMLSEKWFPTARGLITLSQHTEGRPQVMLEAMASGLPILASRLPAHENIIQHGDTGWICDNESDVMRGLSHFEEPANNLRAGEHARDWAIREIGTWDDCAARYAKQYELLLKAAPYA